MLRNSVHRLSLLVFVTSFWPAVVRAEEAKTIVLPKPQTYTYAFPNLLTFHDAPTVIEQKLFVMYLEHRMRTFQGTFHASPDYALWYGWSEMQRDLTEIKELAAEMRRNHTTASVQPVVKKKP